MRDLYSVTLTLQQIARACEAYVLRNNPGLAAKAFITPGDSLPNISVRVSERRASPKPKATQ